MTTHPEEILSEEILSEEILSEEILSEEILSESESEARYPDQWVLVDILEWDAELKITRGIVRATGAEKSPLYQAARQLPAPRKFSVFYTGELPKGQGYST